MRLEAFLALLRRNGVTSYQDRRLTLHLRPLPPPAHPGEAPLPRAGKPPSETELLFGLTEEQARSEGLVT